MIGNIIVVLAVSGAVFYLYQKLRKAKNSHNHTCSGCGACQSSKNDTPQTIRPSMEQTNESKEK